MPVTKALPNWPVLGCSVLLLAHGTNGVAAQGVLSIYANGEELATEGFVAPYLTRDGWALRFDHIFVTLADISAFQTDPPYDPFDGGPPSARNQVDFDVAQHVTVDLATARPDGRVLVGTVSAPAGHYNAVTWSVVPARTGPWAGHSMVLVGTATRSAQRVDFTLTSPDTLSYACGEYVGDQRKGFVTDMGRADLELTFHLDHVFGRRDKDPDDPINLGALGFDQFAAGGEQAIDLTGLHIGHVGEGHCARSRP